MPKTKLSPATGVVRNGHVKLVLFGHVVADRDGNRILLTVRDVDKTAKTKRFVNEFLHEEGFACRIQEYNDVWYINMAGVLQKLEYGMIVEIVEPGTDRIVYEPDGKEF